MNSESQEIRVGNETDYALVGMVELGFPGAPTLLILSASATATAKQKLEVMRLLEQYCLKNPANYSLITQDSRGTDFPIGDSWCVADKMNFFSFTTTNFISSHQLIPEKLEYISSSGFLEYFLQLHSENYSEKLQTLRDRCLRFSSSVYGMVINGRIVTAAEVHENQNQHFSIDMLGTIEAHKNNGFATQLYSFLISQIVNQNLEHTGVTSAENMAMQRVFAKLGATFADSQTTWVRVNSVTSN